MTATLEAIAWPRSRIGDAVVAVASSRKWRPSRRSSAPLPAAASLELAADSAGVEIEPVSLRYLNVESELRAVAPALIPLGRQPAAAVLAVLRSDRRWLHVLTEDLRIVPVSVRQVRDLLCDDMEQGVRPVVDSVLAAAGLAEGRRNATHHGLLRELIGDRPVGNLWLVRPQLRNVGAAAREAHLPSLAALFAVMSVVETSLFVFSWWVLGKMAFAVGPLDALFTLWLLASFSIIPIRAVLLASARTLARNAGALLKRRILVGAVKLSPDEVAGKGSGTHLSHVLESGAIEALGPSGAFMAVTSAVAAAFAVWVLSRGAGGSWHAALFMVWISATIVLSIWFGAVRAAWTDARFALTGLAVENLVGHKTRLAQQFPAERNQGEDERLEAYVERERALNRLALTLDVVRRSWAWVGLFALVPVVLSGSPTVTLLSLSAGGVLLGDQALMLWTDAAASLAAAVTASRRVAPFWRAADREVPLGSAAAESALASPASEGSFPLLRADAISHQHVGRSDPTLHDVDLTVSSSDRILLHGPSGSGKSTLCEVLSGVRSLQSGLLFYRGVDQASVGIEKWRRSVLLVPQFHRNHLFLGSLSYNLFLGGAWPPTAADRAEAMSVCRALDLGPLIDRMPLGLEQPVGETGWQLSHGERSRVFLARAILQKPDLLILDETFAALDAETLSSCSDYLLQRVETVVMVAHT